MDPAKDEEALYELLYNDVGCNGKRGHDAGRGDDDSVDAQEVKVSGATARAVLPLPRVADARRLALTQRLKTELSAKTEECAAMLGQINDLQLQVSLPLTCCSDVSRRRGCLIGDRCAGEKAEAHEGDAGRQHFLAVQDCGRRDREERRAE